MKANTLRQLSINPSEEIVEAALTTKIVDLLASGGDKRIAFAEDGLNRYGCSPQPRLNVTVWGRVLHLLPRHTGLLPPHVHSLA